MERFISYEKLSKKQQRELDEKRRVNWGALNPISRTADDGKKYNRKKARHWKNDLPDAEPFSHSSDGFAL